MATLTLKELATEKGVGQKTPEATDALLLEQADGLPAYTLISDLPAGSGGSSEAGAISAEPHGELEGTDVQAQLEELEANKANIDHPNAVTTITGGLQGQLMTWTTDDVGGPVDPGAYLNPDQVDSGEKTAGTETAIRMFSPADNVDMIHIHAPVGGGGGSGGLVFSNNAGTAISLDEDDFGLGYDLTSDSSIAITLDAQTVVPGSAADARIIGLRKAGSGVVTVSMESGAGYFVAGDDYGGSPSTAAFIVTGFAWVEIRSNVGGSSAVFIVGGETNLARTVAGNTTFSNNVVVTGTSLLTGAVTIDGAVDIDAVVDISQPITLSGTAGIVGGDKIVSAVELKDIAETVVANGALATGAVSFDYSAGGVHTGTTGAGNITSVAITNPPATGRMGAITLIITQGAAARTIAWGAAFRFPGGTDFSLTATIGAIDIFTFITVDGGTIWYGFEGGKAFAA